MNPPSPACLVRVTPLLLAAVLLGACQTMYYDAMEKVGIHKRDILVDRVEEARDAQLEGKEQFQSALERFTELLDFQGGELEAVYEKLNAEYERSVDRAEEVRERIESVENVAEALFDEWQEEIERYSSSQLRRSSEVKLRETRDHYQQMIRAMNEAAKKMSPVLEAFEDQVLFLKHNLNARAIASLQQEFGGIKGDIAVLIEDMERSIGEADAFIKAMEQP